MLVDLSGAAWKRSTFGSARSSLPGVLAADKAMVAARI